MSLESSAISTREKLLLLYDRSLMLQNVRSFFYERNVAEVDCFALNAFPNLDLHIEPLKVETSEKQLCYLHTSPEYGMKKLLSLGMGDIFQLSHVFRKEEKGSLHLTEFTMLEWYRIGFSEKQFIDEILDLIFLFIEKAPFERITYREAFVRFSKIDPSLEKNEILAAHSSLPENAYSWEKKALLDYIWAFSVQPHLGKNKVTMIYDFPPDEAALAQTIIKNKEETALRFEFYIHSFEIANAYVELTDPSEHKLRFEKINRDRTKEGKEALPLDTSFLQALDRGIPECMGVAVGFDRLMMLRHKKDHICDVVPLDEPL